jgi:hypothetical protein
VILSVMLLVSETSNIHRGHARGARADVDHITGLGMF